MPTPKLNAHAHADRVIYSMGKFTLIRRDINTRVLVVPAGEFKIVSDSPGSILCDMIEEILHDKDATTCDTKAPHNTCDTKG